MEYGKCFTDISECYSQSSDKFDADQKFIACARLFQVKSPNSAVAPFKYNPADNDIDAQIWKELQNLENIEPRKSFRTKKNIEKESDSLPRHLPTKLKSEKVEVSEPKIEKPIEKPIELPTEQTPTIEAKTVEKIETKVPKIEEIKKDPKPAFDF